MQEEAVFVKSLTIGRFLPASPQYHPALDSKIEQTKIALC